MRNSLVGLASLTLSLSITSTFAFATTPDSETAATSTGKWRFVAGGDSSNEDVALRLLEEQGRAFLVIRCTRDKPEVRISWVYYLGPGPTAVSIRVGETSAETEDWNLSADHQDAIYPGDSGAFIRRLRTVDSLAAEATRYSESGGRPISLTMRHVIAEENAAREPKVLAPPPPKPMGSVLVNFDLRGLDNAVAEFGASCLLP